VALGIGGTVAIVLSNLDTPWYGLLTVPQNFYAGLAKYPLLAIPMFVLVGSIFDRSGVAKRLVDFAIAIVGRGPGMLPLVSIAVAMFLGGISGSGPACAAAVGAVALAALGYFTAAVAAAGAWLALSVHFFMRRLRGTRRSLRNVVDLAITSACIPLLSIWWRLVGLLRFARSEP